VISNILLALDDSPRAAHVVSVAGMLAARFGATLHPMRAIMVPPEFPASGAGAVVDKLPERLMQQARAGLAHLVMPLVDVVVAAPIVRVGEPAHAILEASESVGAELIAIGSHGYRGWDRVLGTTAAQVANLASCHVFVIHDALLRTGVSDGRPT